MLLETIGMVLFILVLYVAWIFTRVLPYQMAVSVLMDKADKFVDSGWKFPLKPFAYLVIFPKGPQHIDYPENKVSTRPGEAIIQARHNGEAALDEEGEDFVRSLEISIDSAIYFSYPIGERLLKTLEFAGSLLGEKTVDFSKNLAEKLTEKIGEMLKNEIISITLDVAGDKTWQQCYWEKSLFQDEVNEAVEDTEISVVKSLFLDKFKVIITEVNLPAQFKESLDDMETERVKKVAAIINASAEAIGLTIKRVAIRATGLDIQAMLTSEEIAKGQATTMFVPFNDFSDTLKGSLMSGEKTLANKVADVEVAKGILKNLQRKINIPNQTMSDLEKVFEEYAR
ncbi:MAG: hypothetical protein KAS01_00710 [Candidatus Pacebacteria bacterium]|nr:hypothetical protein [Candidatus Paceibacterota bacterium]